MSELMKQQLKDIGIRAGKTFVQGFIAYVLVMYPTIKDGETLNAVLFGGVAAGVSALWNVLSAANSARKQ